MKSFASTDDHSRRRHFCSGLRAAAGPGVVLIAQLSFTGAAAAQVEPASEGARVEVEGPPPPSGGAMINQAGRQGATLRAVRLTERLRIDGVLDEAFYHQVPAITEFVQGVPIEDGDPTERTEVWIAFDDENVYVAGRIWDSAGPDGWIANEMRRDAAQLRSNDHLAVFFDTFYDRRNAVGFSVSPIGGFSDFQITNEGNPNMDWNPVWERRTALFDGGWSVEMAIPFKSLRYRPGREQVWGVQMRRSVMRRNEWIFLRALPLSVGGGGTSGTFRVSMYAALVGLEAPPPSRNLEVRPYAIAGSRTDLAANPRIDGEAYADAGLDLKYGITQNLTADVTFNTDFAQVEVDEQQVNLSRFSLFFPEKREFFLEGRGIFDFGAGAGGGGGGGGGRGGAPTLFYSRTIGLQGGEVVPILAGGRLTGKLGSTDVGLINIWTGDAPSAGAEDTRFSIVRLRRDVFSRSGVGVLFGDRSRSLAGPGANRTWGADGFFGLTDDLSVQGYYAGTDTPGRDGLAASYRGAIAYGGDTFGANLDHLVVGNDFNPEIGFVRRRDFRQTSASGRFSPRPRVISWIRQLTFQADVGYLENERFGYVESRDWGTQFSAQLENGDQFSMGYSENYENLVGPARISGATIPAGRYSSPEVQASYRLGPQRRYSANLSLRRGDYFGGTVTSAGLGGGRVEITPQISLEPSVSFNWIDLPGALVPGEYDQHVAVTRLTYTLTPRAYLSGLVQYNSRSDTLSGNFRFRWEWAPGSELFLVFSEERNREGMDRWPALDNRGLVIKVNRLFRI
ncbi:MAG TPA: DUF5916 domain-containing protein [Longimicrobiaceae bacterium]|nr:DUF5916 domain-containing protein [Longimicrobiaceae bacterium]